MVLSPSLSISKIALLVGISVVAVGVLVMLKQQKAAKGQSKKSTPVKAPKASTPVKSPNAAVTRRIAKGEGSVRTPAGRRSARLARKSLEHND